MAIKLYVAGPMQGRPGFNFAAFDEAAAAIRAMGFEVISPAEMDQKRNPEAYERARKCPHGIPSAENTGGLTWAQILGGDIVVVADEVQGLALLPGWEGSSGARLEVFVGLIRHKLFGLYHPEDRSLQFVEEDHVRSTLRDHLP